jgi:2-amino-4-hydroxy-6-hydroxymethyldihydropteridine diphosphokinase
VSERVFLGLGANIGNREANLRMAVRLVGQRCEIVAVSSLYESPALVADGASPGPDFLNAVCEISTELDVRDLLHYIKRIEWDIGRRPAAQWSPRPIDIDVLLFGNRTIDFGDRTIDIEDLRVPHPRMLERPFVLVPLSEIAPYVVHPQMQRPFAELAFDVDRTGLTRVAGPEWASIRWN